jgi:hypothetical protein
LRRTGRGWGWGGARRRRGDGYGFQTHDSLAAADAQQTAATLVDDRHRDLVTAHSQAAQSGVDGRFHVCAARFDFLAIAW